MPITFFMSFIASNSWHLIFSTLEVEESLYKFSSSRIVNFYIFPWEHKVLLFTLYNPIKQVLLITINAAERSIPSYLSILLLLLSTPLNFSRIK